MAIRCLGFLAPVAAMAQTLLPVQDSYVVPANGANFGSGANIAVGNSSSQGLIQFDLSGLPAGTIAAQVQKALFTIYVNHIQHSWLDYDLRGQRLVDGIGRQRIERSCRRFSRRVQRPGDRAWSVHHRRRHQRRAGWLNSPANNAGFLIQGHQRSQRAVR